MNESRVIQECVRKLAGMTEFRGAQIFSGEVKTVDRDNRECTVESRIDKGSSVCTLNLSAERNDGFIQIPAVGSTVIYVRMANGDNYALAFSDLDEIIGYVDASNSYVFDSTGWVWNGGSLGGMVKVISLTTKLNNIETKINQLVTGLHTALATPVAEPGNGAFSAFQTAMSNALLVWTNSQLTLTMQANIENPAIKQ